MLLGFLIQAVAKYDQRSEDAESAWVIAQKVDDTSPTFLLCRFCVKKVVYFNTELVQ